MKYTGYFKNRPELTKEEIDKSRDFDNLLRQLENGAGSPESQSEAPKAVDGNATGTVVGIKSWLMVAAGLAASLALVWIFMNQGRDIPPVAVQESDTVQFAAVNPPLQGVDIPWISASINPNRDTVLQLGSASVRVPAGAIVRQDGSAPGEHIDINYREFMDAVDIFISGIPMNYDSAGTSYTFESAGMFELRASEANKELRIAGGKTIEVSLNSPWQGSRFNQYRLDDSTGVWEFLGADREMAIASDTLWQTLNLESPFEIDALRNGQLKALEVLRQDINKRIENLMDQAPKAPELADPFKQTISIQADVKHFPELAPYEGFRFEVLDIDNFDARKSGKEWNDIKVLRGAREGEYILSFWRPDEKYDVVVKPVLSEKDFAKAMKTYEKLFAEYEAGAKKKEDELRRQKEAFDRQLEEIRQERERRRQQAIAQEQTMMASMNMTTRVQRVFSLASFGYYNSDYPIMLPTGVEVQLNPIAQQTGAAIGKGTVYLVETDRNAVYSIYPGAKLSFNPAQKNIAWLVTAEGNLAIADTEEFAKVDARKETCEMKFKVFEKQPKTAEEVKQLLSPYVQI